MIPILSIMKSMRNKLPMILIIFIVLSFNEIHGQPTPCQTPNHRDLIIYLPMYWLYPLHGIGANNTHDLGDYGDEPSSTYRVVFQSNAPNPGPSPLCNLMIFLQLMQIQDIGILYIFTHGPQTGGAIGLHLEYHMTVQSVLDSLESYVYNHGILPDFLAFDTTGSPPYSIGLTELGLLYYCQNLEGALVVADGCSTSCLNQTWGAKISVGWDHSIESNCYGGDNFFERMLGRDGRATGNTNFCREAHDAASQIIWVNAKEDTAHLICYQPPGQEMDIVLSPIIIEHYPGYQPDYGHYGQIVFDCKMHQYNPAFYVIALTGPPNFHLQDIHWTDDYTLKYFLPETESAPCWIDFVVSVSKIFGTRC